MQGVGGGLRALTSHQASRGTSDTHPRRTWEALAKDHLPDCPWGQDLLLVREVPGTQKRTGQGHMETVYLLPTARPGPGSFGTLLLPLCNGSRVKSVVFKPNPNSSG